MDRNRFNNISLESPFQRYLSTNYIPTDTEIKQIRGNILPDCEVELARLNSLIQDLTAQRDRVQDYLASHEALISQARRLPQDILGEIFLACLPTGGNAVMSAREAPLLLGHICRAWRSLSFSQRRLWTSLHIAVEIFKSSEGKSGVVEWLVRSDPLPLTISVDSHKSTQYSAAIDTLIPLSSRLCTQYSSVIATLIPLSSRLTALRLSNLRSNEFLALASVNSPLLTDVHIDFREDIPPADGARILASNIFLGTNIQRIAITSATPRSLIPSTDFAWDHITDLCIERNPVLSLRTRQLGLDRMHSLMRGCSRLRFLRIQVQLGANMALSVGTPLLLSSLRELTIIKSGTKLDALLQYLNNDLRMPQLSKLHLIDLYPCVGEAITFDRLADHSPLISDFCFNVLSFESTAPNIRNLRAFTSLEKLSVVVWAPRYAAQYDVFDKDVIELFSTLTTPDVDNTLPVPFLRELSVEMGDMAEGEWMSFLQYQVDHSPKFQRLHLHLWREPDADPVDRDRKVRLAQFRATGLDVSVDYTIYPDEEEAFEDD
ncbi:hypothetical protein R3P38DRAFT_3295148 [Favolaschia claudopus]|uniref:F-box domain-containing protein n=1 Tax=Favolaschia claudopus TaxID=2862362 RepID=A0AAV9ZC05_9AGAR